LAANLAAGELALNTNDGKLYYKNSGGVVSLLASNAATTNVSSISFGSTGLTPSTATTGAVTVAGTLAVANGWNPQTSFTAGQIHSPVTFSTSANLFYDSANTRFGVGTGARGDRRSCRYGCHADSQGNHWAAARRRCRVLAV
jgi:hypothetical protein